MHPVAAWLTIHSVYAAQRGQTWLQHLQPTDRREDTHQVRKLFRVWAKIARVM